MTSDEAIKEELEINKELGLSGWRFLGFKPPLTSDAMHVVLHTPEGTEETITLSPMEYLEHGSWAAAVLKYCNTRPPVSDWLNEDAGTKRLPAGWKFGGVEADAPIGHVSVILVGPDGERKTATLRAEGILDLIKRAGGIWTDDGKFFQASFV